MAFKILGTSEEVLVCECCGKTNLKKTVVLGSDSGEVYYGVNCAAQALRGTKKASDKKAIESIADACAYGRKWLDVGRTPEVVAQGIWNRYGYTAEVKSGAIVLHGYKGAVLASIAVAA